MRSDRRPGWHDVVRRHWQKTTGFLLASTEPCVEVRDDELAAIEERRVLVGLSIEDLEAWDPPRSWLLGAVLCPGDSTEPLAAWAKDHDVDPSRVHFYLHPDTPWSALLPWDDAGYPTDQVDDDVDSWTRLHRLFGLALNERVVKDWAGMP